MLIQTSDATFQQDVLDEKRPVLVDFWAPWCAPCKQLTPILENLAQTMGDTLSIVQLNVDDHQETPSSHGIRNIPSLLLFQNSKVLGTQVGVQSHDALVDWINSLIIS